MNVRVLPRKLEDHEKVCVLLQFNRIGIEAPTHCMCRARVAFDARLKTFLNRERRDDILARPIGEKPAREWAGDTKSRLDNKIGRTQTLLFGLPPLNENPELSTAATREIPHRLAAGVLLRTENSAPQNQLFSYWPHPDVITGR